MIDKEEFVSRLSTLFEGFCQGEPLPPVALDTDLFEVGILDSLRIVELVVFVETLIDVDIPVEDYQPESFRTIEGIYQIAEESTGRAHGAPSDARPTGAGAVA